MGWFLDRPPAGMASAMVFPIPREGYKYIVLSELSKTLEVVDAKQKLQTLLAQIDIASHSIKVKAFKSPLRIIPDSASRAKKYPRPDIEHYELQPSTTEHSEAIILRHGDEIESPELLGHSLKCRWDSSEIQVNSSAPEVDTDTRRQNGIPGTPEGDDTEDEAMDLDRVAVVAVSATQTTSQQPKSQQSGTTPQLSNYPSVVIHETPTIDRITLRPQHAAERKGLQKVDNVDVEEEEAFSTAPNGDSGPGTNEYSMKDVTTLLAVIADETADTKHRPRRPTDEANVVAASKSSQRSRRAQQPKVVIHKSPQNKRASSSREADGELPIQQSRKRTKQTTSSKGDITDNENDTITVDAPHERHSRYKKRVSDAGKCKEESPSGSQRISQRSDKQVDGTYNGHIPCVAFSNSAITQTSQAFKFLKKHKGSMVETINDKCNILCVKSGPLLKTMKLLEAIALGIPIVTDKWLLDSAKAGYLLALEGFVPDVPDQEKEWSFNFQNIWNKPQTPFTGYTVYFTFDLQKSYTNFNEIKKVCTVIGAKVAKNIAKGDNNIFLAKEEGDSEAEKLFCVGETCYTKDLLANSILRGGVDLTSDEFKINWGIGKLTSTGPTPNSKTSKAKRSRTS